MIQDPFTKYTSITQAIKAEDVDYVKAYLEAYPEEAKGFDGTCGSLLHWAVTSDSEKRQSIVGIITNHHHVDINAMDSEGETPLHWAVWSGSFGMVERLISLGVEIDKQDLLEEQSALHKASKAGYFSLVQALVVAGADMELLDEDRLSASDLAKKNQHEEIAEYLNGALSAKKEQELLSAEIASYKTDDTEVKDHRFKSAL